MDRHNNCDYSKDKAVRSYNASDEAAPWFQSHGINPDSVMFSTYEDPDLTVIPNAVLLVGQGSSISGETGFAIEILPGVGVVQAHLFHRPGHASHHKTIAAKAKALGIPFIEVAQTMK
ncbi:hypothetical protein [Marinobacter sp. W-8]|uniref:hypothetical protein n=1 Tax=Marinobacter sp. W-8 TaxID=3369658 RepID=UPI0037C5F502